ncbi:hypothetical protein BH10PSE19_BH10PSE19_22050 [soil metagenome]
MLSSMGPTKLSHPEEYNAVIRDLKANNVEISFRDNQLAYGPASLPGRPGNIVLSPDASISALRHEYGHFLDDKALGFPGMRAYYENPSLRVATERRQYLAEINLAKSIGDMSARRLLVTDYLAERAALVDRFYTNPYGYNMRPQ